MDQHPENTDQPNQELENYKKIKVLGKGSFGKAFLVQAESDNSFAVIKRIDIAKMSEEEKRDTIKEAKILEVLNHPNIIRFREVYKTKKGQLCIVMDYADGGDLSKLIQKQKDENGAKCGKDAYLSEDYILSIFTQICLAIKHCHDRKILHRDLKAQNIFMMSNGIVKLGDFGIAKVLSTTIEQAVTIVGTPYYLSPEIIKNEPYNFKSDMWSLGVILYELCALKPPFNGNNIHMLAMQIVKGSFTALPNYFSHEIKQLIQKLLHQDPKRRPDINSLISEKLLKSKVQQFLSKNLMQEEFSHTILHKQNIFDKFHKSLMRSQSNFNANEISTQASEQNEFESINYVIQNNRPKSPPKKYESFGINKAANDVLNMINKIEQNKFQQPAAPVFVTNLKQQNNIPQQMNQQNQFNNQLLQGQKLPGIFKNQQKNLEKIQEEAKRQRDKLADLKAKQQYIDEQKRLKILEDMNKKADQDRKRRDKERQEQDRKQRQIEEERDRKVQERNVLQQQMKEDMKKRKMAAKGKGPQFEIVGADIQDILDQNHDFLDYKKSESLEFKKQEFIEIKQPAQRKGWNRDNDSKPKKTSPLDGEIEILVSKKDQQKIEMRKQIEEEYEKQTAEDLEKNYREYNKYINMLGKACGIEEDQLAELPKLDDDEVDENEEINFDELLQDAAQQQAELDSDREDQDQFDEESDLNYTKTQVQPIKSDQSKEDELWDYVINLYGRQEFEVVHAIIKQYSEIKYTDDGQILIAAEANQKLYPLGMEDPQKQKDLIGLVQSFMIVEEFKVQNKYK